MQEFPWAAARVRPQEIDRLPVTMIGKGIVNLMRLEQR